MRQKERRARIWELYSAGKLTPEARREVAREFNCDIGTISGDLRAIDPVRRAAYERSIDTSRANSSLHRAQRYGASGAFTTDEWINLKAKQNGQCANCGQTSTLSPDHIIPLARGGSNSIENIQGLCSACNFKKNDKMPGEARRPQYGTKRKPKQTQPQF